MAWRELILCSGVALGTWIGVGCNRKQLRPEPARAAAPLPSPLARELAAQPPLSEPTPPPPPTTIQPPRPNALSGIVPPIPQQGSPTEMPPAEIPDSPDPVVPAGYEDITGGPIREKLGELKSRVKDRREEKGPVLPILPARGKPKTPDLPNTLPEPESSQPPPTTAKPLPESDLTIAKQRLDAALASYAQFNDFECRAVKQEVIAGKTLPREESIYRLRKQPLSVYNRVLSDEGQGREMLYVRGKFGDKMHVITGKGDNILIGAGFKTDLDPDSKTATSKSRWKVYEAGFTRNLDSLGKAIAATDVRHPLVKSLGLVKRPEYPYELFGVEFSVLAKAEYHLPKGGLRTLYFDPNPESPSRDLPVVVLTRDDQGKQVEYYAFDRFKIPSGWTEADWNPARLGKK